MSDRPPRTESELVEFVRSIDVRAPDSLHRQVDALIAAGTPTRRRLISPHSLGGAQSVAVGTAVAAVAALVAVVIALGLGGSTPSKLSVRTASALTLSAAKAPAPGVSPSNGAELAAAVDGVSFPYWEDRFGWRSIGSRSDDLDGRQVTTVFYADRRGRRIGYAIVAGSPTSQIRGGVIIWRGGVPYHELVENGASVVTWLRDGHLCVVSGRGVDSATLLALASSGGRGSFAS